DSHTGNLYLAGQLDREEQEEYFLSVSANDGSWRAQTTVTLYILDENDNTPQFDRSTYEFDVDLSTEHLANRTIGRVEASDRDQALNGLVYYKLKNKSKYFQIDSQTGEIFIKRLPRLFASPDLDFLNQHFLTVIAFDKGILPRSSES